MSSEPNPAWAQAQMPNDALENRRKAMQSNLFSDNLQNSSQQPQNNPIQNNYDQQRPPQPTFMSPPPKQFQNNQYNSNIAAPEVPALSPFPDFSIDLSKLNESFDFGMKPKPAPESKPMKKLNFTTSNQMKIMRDDLNRDFSEFQKRMKRLGTSEGIKMETIKFAEHKPIVHRPPPVSLDDTIPIPQKSQRGNRSMNNTIGNTNNPDASLIDSQNFETNEEPPSFTTVSEFLLPDGSKYA